MYTALLVGAYVVALTALFASLLRPQSDKSVKRAFEALEDDFGDLRENVASALGRISRLKRSTLDLTRRAGAEEDASVPAPSDSAPGLTPNQQAVQEKILRRRSKLVPGGSDGLLPR